MFQKETYENGRGGRGGGGGEDVRICQHYVKFIPWLIHINVNSRVGRTLVL